MEEVGHIANDDKAYFECFFAAVAVVVEGYFEIPEKPGHRWSLAQP